MKIISVRAVRLDRLSAVPVVTLREDEMPRRQFEIFIGNPEAAAIKLALDGETTPRPLTHDLYVLTIENLGLEILRVVLTHVSDGTYFADIVLGTSQGEVVVSARPSDALAVALRASCPIYANEDLLDLVGEVLEDEPVNTEAEMIDEFRDFIEKISPEDFG